MEIELEDLVRLVVGAIKELPGWPYSGRARDHLRCDSSLVYLSTQTAQKILRKHGEKVDLACILLIPTALNCGLWIADNDKACCVTYNSEPVRYVAAVGGRGKSCDPSPLCWCWAEIARGSPQSGFIR